MESIPEQEFDDPTNGPLSTGTTTPSRTVDGRRPGTEPDLVASVLPRSGAQRNSTVTLSGSVIDGDGEPCSGATVRWHASTSANTSLIEFTTRTLSDGSFVIDGAPPSKGRLSVDHFEHLPTTLPNLDPASNPWRIELSHGGVVEATVLVDGSPRSDVQVHLSGGSVHRTTTSAEDGIARIRGLDPGRYQLRVGKIGVAEGEESGEESDDPPHEEKPITVTVEVQRDEPTEIELEISAVVRFDESRIGEQKHEILGEGSVLRWTRRALSHRSTRTKESGLVSLWKGTSHDRIPQVRHRNRDALGHCHGQCAVHSTLAAHG